MPHLALPPPPVAPPDPCHPVATFEGLGLGPILNKKYKVRLTAPLDALLSVTLQSANQCDIVPEVPDFSWPLISYSVSGSHDGFPAYELYATFR